MGSFDVEQRTKDGMFNATALSKQWNNQKVKGRKDVSNFLSNANTKEFINALSEDLETDTRNLVTIVKGKNQGTWLHPYLFIKFSMWLDAKFEIKVIKFVYDELIKQRTDAGDGYKTLSSSGVKLQGYNFGEVGKAMQWIVYNKTGKNLRQTANQEQLQEINEIQTKLAFAIDMNYITSYNQLLSEMRKMYNKKYQKF